MIPTAPSHEPIFNVPRPVLVVLAILVLIHVGRGLLPAEDDLWLVLAAAFIPGRYEAIGVELPGGAPALFTSPFTHMLLHGDWMHLALNSAWLLAFGGAIAERTGAVKFYAFFIVCGLAGAAAFYIANAGLMQPMIGASGAISGLMGAALRFLFPALDSGGFRRLREAPRSVRLMSLSEALTDRRILVTSAILVVINVLAIVGFGVAQNSAGIAWEAHLGGYLLGLFTYGLFDSVSADEDYPQPNVD
ncbi:rhomboid family intramembrane serine protease [Hyphomicrobium sp.]|uniref:rhomboid family intramembrane serine protease n=1 Tax=Hyphomicrobium sp. TaxID=82 RepID=UPI0025C14D19|nr:rhomboid family intramembrane serine protease [Hyphomicrobium sp.]MCC7253125.1 rhomboid family intramembrane serine protease [Hyphomicrobium sp.]